MRRDPSASWARMVCPDCRVSQAELASLVPPGRWVVLVLLEGRVAMARLGLRVRGDTAASRAPLVSLDLRVSPVLLVLWVCAEMVASAAPGVCRVIRSRDRRECRDLWGRPDPWVPWVLRARTVRLVPLVPRARRALQVSLVHLVSQACRGLPDRLGRWARTAPTACRDPRELWDRTVSRASQDRKGWPERRVSPVNKALLASMAFPVPLVRPVSEVLLVQMEQEVCLDRTERLALLVSLVHPAPRVPRARLALPVLLVRTVKGMVITIKTGGVMWRPRMLCSTRQRQYLFFYYNIRERKKGNGSG